MIKMIRRFSEFLILFSLCYPARATEYYVSDASEIQNAMSSALPGDTLTMANGIWTDQDIDFVGNGTESKPILLRAETPGSVILTGHSRMDIYGSYLVVDGLYFLNGYGTQHKVHVINIQGVSHHCRLTNTAIVDYNPPEWELYYKWLQIEGQYHRVDHCYFSGKTHRDALLKVVIPSNEASYSRLDHNYFGDFPLGMTSNNWETLRIQGDDLAYGQVIIEDNLFYRCDGETEIISLKAGDNDVCRNTFYESVGSVTCRKNEGNRIYGNFFIGNDVPGTGGVRMYTKDHLIYNNYFERLTGGRTAIAFMYAQYDSLQLENPEVENVTVAFNTMVECDPTIQVGISYSESSGRVVPPRDLLIANNLIYQTAGVMINHNDGVENITYAGNIMFGTTLGISDTAGITFVDPQLEFAEGIWRLGTSSPAINAAVGTYPYVTSDIDGQIRLDGLNDVGSDEFSSGEIINRPLTKDDVGPPWLRDGNLPVGLSVFLGGNGSGTVSLNPPGGIYDIGTEVALVALPDSGHSFAGWSGDATGSDDTLTVLMDGHKRITATFEGPVAYDVHVWNYSGSVSGYVELDPADAPYQEGTVVCVTAVPSSGWAFNHWGGDLDGSTANPESLLVTEDRSITVTFVQTATGVMGRYELPFKYDLGQNHPNPFNPTTWISFDLEAGGMTTLSIYDLQGRLVALPVSEYLVQGHHKIKFDGAGLSSGIYIYRLNTPGFSAVRKMILTR